MPNPTILDSFATFGALLKYLRLRVRLNQTELAIAVGYSTAQISRLEQNQRLPDLTMLVALFVPALDLEDEPETVARLLELAAEARGEHLLGRSVTITHTVRHEQRDAVDEQASPIARSATTHQRSANLPIPSTPLIGREQDVALVCERLLRPDVRLLTLIGSPGVGKTRLGLEAATRLNDTFTDGVFFVGLAPVRDPHLVVSTIAQVLDATEEGDLSFSERLKNALRDRHCLLVLDNFEHVLEARALIAELLAAAPRLRILVTSRATLHLSAEHAFDVPPLVLPDLAHLPPLDILAQYSAVALFIARAKAVSPTFALTSANALAVAALCAHLDGLPLAIELAAARSKLLSPQALLTRLVHRFRLLTGGAHDLPSRHQTLKNALDWSYELLGIDQQRVFAWLAVFIGGWRLEAAEYVAGALGRDGSGALFPPQSSQLASSRTSLLDAQATLLDQSLLLREITADGEQRLMMLETIREYALERLTERDEGAAARQQHARYFLELAEAAEPELIGPDQSAWFARLEEEHDNLRAALHWAHQAGAIAWGLRLASALWRFWYEHGHLAEGRHWLEQALATSATPEVEGDGAAYRAKALNGLGVIAWRQGDTQQAMALLEASLGLREQLGDTRGIAQTLSNLGILVAGRGEYERASALHAQSLVLNRALSNDWGVAASLLNLGNLAIEQGAYERAVALHEEGLALNRQINDAVGIALSMNNLGVALMMQGDYERAAPLYEESLSLHRGLGDKLGIAYALTNLGNVACKQGDRRWATVLFAESLALSQAMGNKLCIAESLAGLATVACMQAPRSVGARRAAKLCGVVAALRVAINAPLAPADQVEFDATLSVARQELGKERCASAWAEGQAMAMDQAIAYALDAGISEPFGPFPPFVL